jgi:hypothetical protein
MSCCIEHLLDIFPFKGVVYSELQMVKNIVGIYVLDILR